MKDYILLITLLVSMLFQSCADRTSKGENNEVQTDEETVTEEFVGVKAISKFIMDKEYYGKFEALARAEEAPWAYANFLDQFDPLREALVCIIGGDKFAELFTYYGVSNPVKAKDGWIIIWLARTHSATNNATIFIDTNENLMYVQWLSPNTNTYTLYYELRDGEKSAPATIKSRKFPDFVKDKLAFDI